MPIFSEHPQYTANKSKWRELRDTIGGSRFVKADDVATNYLPMLTGETTAEYKARKGRALFYAATGRTVSGLCGAIFRKDPILRPEMKEENDKDERLLMTKDGKSVGELLYEMVLELLSVGRWGTLNDFAAGENPKSFVAPYVAETIINWDSMIVDGEEKHTLIVLKESYPDPKNTDKFVKKERTQYRELSLDSYEEDGKTKYIYVVRVWRCVADTDTRITEDWVVDSEIVPTFRGIPLEEIPFTFYNIYDGASDVKESPIEGVSEVNLAHYKNSADLEHGRHFTGLPTAVFSGFQTHDEAGKEVTYRIGSTTAMVSSDSDAKASYMEVRGNFKSLENGLQEKQNLMAVLGARILDEQRNTVEAADTHKIRRIGENSVLASLSKSASKQFTKVLKIWAKWNMLSRWEAYSVLLNTDFDADRLSAQELTALVLAWQNGSLSDETLVYNYKQGEMLPPGVTVEDEIKLIRAKMEEKALQDYKTATGQKDVEKTLGKLTDPDNPNSDKERQLTADLSNYNNNQNQLSKSR